MSVSILINRNPDSKNIPLFHDGFGDTAIFLPLSGALLDTV